jgi:hypothetical protein
MFAHRLLGLNPRTLARYVERGWITPGTVTVRAFTRTISCQP